MNFFLLLLVQLLSLFGAVVGDEVSDLISKATKYLVASQYNEAIQMYSSALKKDPKNQHAYFYIATARLALGQNFQALSDLEHVLKIDPSFMKARKKRDSLLIQVGKADRAQTEALAYLKQHPNDEHATEIARQSNEILENLRHAKAATARNSLQDAIHYWNNVLEHATMDHDSRVARADCFIGLGKKTDAISDLVRSVNLKNDNTDGILRLSELYYDNGQNEQALSQIRQCLKLDQDHKACKKFYTKSKKVNKFMTDATKRINEEDYATATIKYQAAYDMTKDSQEMQTLLSSRLCFTKSKESSAEGALKICNVAINSNPEDAENYCNRAEVYINLDKFDEATADFRKALELDEHNSKAKDGVNRAEQLKKQANKRDYYKILGVGRKATTKQITSAYRKLARKWHPDKWEDPVEKEKAEKKFVDLNHAKEVLSDKDMRRQFDQGVDPLDPETQQGGGHHHGGFDPFSGFGGFHQHRQRRGGGGGGGFHFHRG